MKPKNNKCETLSVDEFIDVITDGKGQEIKEALRKIESGKNV